MKENLSFLTDSILVQKGYRSSFHRDIHWNLPNSPYNIHLGVLAFNFKTDLQTLKCLAESMGSSTIKYKLASSANNLIFECILLTISFM